ncbi:MAG: hypothetical protein JWM80_5588 [Cyanobacteria bacterium RYN_339]|nr:hypothetical protein [Cyanobacteria bacterium RYN_339]
MTRWLAGLLLPLALGGCTTDQLAQAAIGTLTQAFLGGPGSPIVIGGAPGGGLATADQAPTGPYAALIQQAHARVNEARLAAGVKPLVLDATISQVAALSAEARGNHTPVTYAGSPVDQEGKLLAQVGVDASTLANLQTQVLDASGASAVDNLLAEPGHREGIVNAAFGHVGYGVYRDAGGHYWWVMDEVR